MKWKGRYKEIYSCCNQFYKRFTLQASIIKQLNQFNLLLRLEPIKCVPMVFYINEGILYVFSVTLSEVLYDMVILPTVMLLRVSSMCTAFPYISRARNLTRYKKYYFWMHHFPCDNIFATKFERTMRMTIYLKHKCNLLLNDRSCIPENQV